MRVIETKVYKFEELSDEGKQKAVEKLYDINVSHDWWKHLYEDAANIGLKLTGFDLDRNRYAAGNFTLAACEVAANIFRDHGETCETYKTATDFMEEWQPAFNKYMETEGYELEQELIRMESEFEESLIEDYSILLQKEYDYQTSEEAIIETIEANDYEFTEEGELV
jgi:hypothetical protein